MVSDIDYTKMAIVNGEDVAENSLIAKSTVAIGHYFVGFNEFEPFCSGVIVSKIQLSQRLIVLKISAVRALSEYFLGKIVKKYHPNFLEILIR